MKKYIPVIAAIIAAFATASEIELVALLGAVAFIISVINIDFKEFQK